MTDQPITSVTDGWRKQVKRFAEDSIDRAIAEGVLDKDGIQKLIENGDDFQARFIALIKELLDRFADEDVSSNYAYPEEYRGPRAIAEQVATLRKLFSELKDATYDESVATQPFPLNAEGWFAIPRWQKLGATYGKALDKVLTAIGDLRKFMNYRETDSKHLRQHAKTAEAFQQFEDEQRGHDILVVACQLGLRHRGRSVRRARALMDSSEFGLGAFAVGTIIMIHPERLVRWNELDMDCAGDEFSSEADGQFVNAPYFDSDGDKVRFSAHWANDAFDHYGSASGFLPQ